MKSLWMNKVIWFKRILSFNTEVGVVYDEGLNNWEIYIKSEINEEIAAYLNSHSLGFSLIDKEIRIPLDNKEVGYLGSNLPDKYEEVLLHVIDFINDIITQVRSNSVNTSESHEEN